MNSKTMFPLGAAGPQRVRAVEASEREPVIAQLSPASRKSVGRPIVAVLALVAGALVGVFCAVPAAQAAQSAKLFESFIGGTSGVPALGGTFASPRDVAVNEASVDDGNPGASGDFYVVDDANHRIQRFNSDGSFDIAWGADVVQSGRPGDLSDGLPLEPNPFEICTAAGDCKAGVPTGGNGFASGNGSLDNPQGIAVDQDTGDVYVSNRDNRRIDVYDADGTPLRAFGFDVVATGPGDGGTGYEICVPANGDVCKTGVGASNPSGTSPGPNPGQFSAGATANGFRLDVSKPDGAAATGKVYLANTGSQRVEVFELDGASPTSFGTTANFASAQPLGVAIDPDGIVYASNSANSFAILRYDTDAGAFLSPLDASMLIGGSFARVGLEVDRSTGNLFVASSNSVLGLAEIADPGSGASLAGLYSTGFATVFTPFSVGVDPGSGRAWTSTSTGGRVAVFGSRDAPVAETDPVASGDITANGARLEGSVDPNDSSTGYQFEIRAEGSSAWIPTEFGRVAAGSVAVPVSASVDGLLAETTYHVRLAASSSDARAYSASVSFTTPAGPPTVTAVSSTPSRSATHIGAVVRPNGFDTDYRIEVGTADCASSTCEAVKTATLGAAEGEQRVSIDVSDLDPGTEYRFRVVAENAEGVGERGGSFSTPATASCANDALRERQKSLHLSGCRAYELVSPAKKYNGGVVIGHRAAADGDAAAFYMNTPLAEGDGGFPMESYIARRGPDGWKSASTALPMRADRRGTGGITTVASDFSDDFETAYLRTNDPVDPADAHPFANPLQKINDGFDFYRMDMRTRQADWLTRPVPSRLAEIPAGFGEGTDSMAGRSEDGQHIVYRALTRPPTADGAPAGALFESVNGVPRLVSILPDGTPVSAETASLIRLTAESRGSQSVSADGRRIYWSAGGLYLRQDGIETRPLSASRRDGEDEARRSATFLGATRDGSRVLLFSGFQLVDEAPSGGLYAYDADNDELTFVAGAASVASRTSQGYEPQFSEEGSRLYFKADAPLTVDAAPGGGLYTLDGQRLRYVAPMSPDGTIEDMRLRISREGRFAAFSSSRSLDPRHTEGAVAIYRYDAESGEVECASCRPDGSASTRDVDYRAALPRYGLVTGALVMPRSISDDGRIVFQTDESLLSRDSNGNADVYEFGPQGLELISGGKHPGAADVVDSSEDGSSVFFLTPESLVGSDTDGGYPDVYVARAGGGFPDPDPPAPPCQGDACQGGGSDAPPPPQVGTLTFHGAGDQRPARPSRVSISGLRRVSGARGRLRVTVPGAGAVSLSGRLVRRATTRASKAATYDLRIALKPAARKALWRKGRLRVSVRVAFRARTGGAASSRTIALTFVRPKGGR